MKERNLTNRTVWSREVLKGSLEGLIIALLLFLNPVQCCCGVRPFYGADACGQ